MMQIVNTEVAGYPDCMDTGCNVMAVLCYDEVAKQYAVYAGIVKLDGRDPFNVDVYAKSKWEAAQLVAVRGNKQTEQQARKYFPGLPKGKYRE